MNIGPLMGWKVITLSIFRYWVGSPKLRVQTDRCQTAETPLIPQSQAPSCEFKFLRNGNNAGPPPFPFPQPTRPHNPSQFPNQNPPQNLAIPSRYSSDRSVAGVAGGMAQTPNPSRRSLAGPAPMPFLTPRPERRHLEMRWTDGGSQSAVRRSGVGAVAGNGGGWGEGERDREVNVQVVLRCR